TGRSSRPADWAPWTAEVEPGVSACALSPKVLVCPGNGGAVTALGAADGKQLWKVPGRGEGLRSGPQYPAVVGDTAYVTGPDGVVAYGLRDGRELGGIPGPGDEWAVKGTDLLDGVLYSTYVNQRDERTGLVTAVRLDRREELWRSPLDGLPEQPVAAGGRVLVTVGHLPLSLDARTGKAVARGTEDCGGLTVHEKSGSVLCSGRQDGRIGVLDAGTLRLRRTLGSTVSAEPAVNADGLVAVVDGDTEVVAYDLGSGRERWRRQTRAGDRVYLVGDRVVTTGRDTVESHPVSGSGDSQDYRINLPDDFDQEVSGNVLAAGGVVYLSLPDGLVSSAYLP
ncbi:PQQ-binding-like beta-propeller repeat protein, partial [Streptomyces sp. SR27]|uniref:outer membrane protein assembly factor BamB family protein n=1 Tax=Streptomyces sp. SR27 TaxID=3076630 RepID=UPI00295BF293